MVLMLSDEWEAYRDFSASLSLGMAFVGFDRVSSFVDVFLLSFDGFDVFDEINGTRKSKKLVAG